MGKTVTGMPRAFAHLSDEAVVALIARSDDQALAELYDRFGRVAYGLALRILRDEALAEDAVQDAFLTAWRRADTFMPERAKASTWLLTLVHRRAVDLVRREERRRAEPIEAAEERAGARAAARAGGGRLRRMIGHEYLRCSLKTRRGFRNAMRAGPGMPWGGRSRG